ncbi:MAG: GNAT family N-acetyltransferase [Acidimicrobiales bacterium]|nr:GNAT family N-acetyltransferase [Acidimicrobiales bacterium]
MMRSKIGISHEKPAGPIKGPLITGKRITLRPLGPEDYQSWQEVRTRCHAWLVKWEPRVPNGGYLETTEYAFRSRIGSLSREREMGTCYGFGIFLGERFIGEINLSGIIRGAFSSGTIGYWIDEAAAGQGYIPESVVTLLGFAFEYLRLHRIEIAIVPRNKSSLRVVEKLELRFEGVAIKFLQIDGQWEDHARYAILESEWIERRQKLCETWVNRG